MLMLALKKDNEIIHIKDALVKTDYYCNDCGGILRVRNGPKRVKHFFHQNKDCGSEGESLIHRYWKDYFVNLKEFEGYNIVASKAEVPLLRGSYIPDVFLKNDKGTYIIIEIFYKNPKTDDYQKFFKILGDKGVEKVYEVQVDYEKILDIKILFDREKNREIERKKEELTKYLFKEVERKRQYILDKYYNNGGLIWRSGHCITTVSFALHKEIKPFYNYAYNKFARTWYRYIVSDSLKYKKFKVYLIENIELENEYVSAKSKSFYINIYHYKIIIDNCKETNCSFLGSLYSEDKNLRGYIDVVLDEEELKH